VSDLSLSVRNPILVYSLLTLYGLLTIFLIVYVHRKFRTAAKTLKVLETQWQSAESKHANFVGDAQEKLSKFAAPAPGQQSPVAARNGGVGLDMRNQIVSMAKRGMRAGDIARACGLQEGEIEVILGMARLGKPRQRVPGDAFPAYRQLSGSL